jgi:hypothetical protein
MDLNLPGGVQQNTEPEKTTPSSNDTYSIFSKGVQANLGTYEGTALDPAKPLFTEYADQPFGLYETNYFRYANRSSFDRLGFSPFVDNEAIYNADASWYGEIGRGIRGAVALTGVSALDTLRSTGDLLRGDWESFISPDTSTALEFSDIMSRYGSTKGGATGFIANNLISTGFVTGMVLGSIPEYAAEALITAEAGGVGAFAGIANTGRKIFSGLRTADKALDAVKAGRKASTVLNQAGKSQKAAGAFARVLKQQADNIINVGGNKVVNMLNPFGNTTDFLVDMARAAKAGEALPSLAKGSGAMLRDMSLFKAAMTEATLEGGFTSNEVRDRAIAEFTEKNGRRPNEDELAQIQDAANLAGHRNVMGNLPVVLLTDKMVFEPLMKMGRTTSRVFGYNPVSSNLASRGIRNVDGTFTSKKISGANFKETMKLRSKAAIKGLLSPSGYVRRGKAVLKAGAGEGIQEVFQEISGGVFEEEGLETARTGRTNFLFNSYADNYKNLVEDPSQMPFWSMSGYLGDNVMKQFSGQGVETFLSGLFIGGLVGGGGSKLTKLMSLSTAKGRANYQAAKAEQDSLTEDLVNILNENIKDPFALFNPRVKNHIQAKELLKEQTEALLAGDFKKAKDIAEELRFNHLSTALQTGTYDIFKSKLEEMRQLDDAGISEATGIENANEARERLEESISYAESLKERYDQANKKFTNPFNPTAYNPNTEEYNRNKINYLAFEDARRDYIFLAESADKTQERMQNLRSEMGASGITSNWSAADVDSLTSVANLNREIGLLEEEILVGKGAQTEEEKKLLNEKKAKLKSLKSYKSELDKYINLVTKLETDSSPAADARREKAYEALKAKFSNYVNTINEASENPQEISQETLDNVFDSIVDHHLLEKDYAIASRSLNILNNPAALTELALRKAAIAEDVFVNRRKHIRKSVKTFKEKLGSNLDILNRLKGLGVVIPHDQLEAFIEKGEMPTELFSLYNGGEINLTKGKGKQAMQLITEYAEAQQERYAEKQKEAEAEAAEQKAKEEAAKKNNATPEQQENNRTESAKEDLKKEDKSLTVVQAFAQLAQQNKGIAVLLANRMAYNETQQTQEEFLNTPDGAKIVAIIQSVVEAYDVSQSTQPIHIWLRGNGAAQSIIIADAIAKYYPNAETSDIIAQLAGSVERRGDIAKAVEDIENSSDVITSVTKVYEDATNGYYVIEIKSNIAGQKNTEYSIVDASGAPIQSLMEPLVGTEVTTSKEEIINYLKGLGSTETATTETPKGKKPFVFDGRTLYEGQTLYIGNRKVTVDRNQTVDENGIVQRLRVRDKNGIVLRDAITSMSDVRVEAPAKISNKAQRLGKFTFGSTAQNRKLSDKELTELTEARMQMTEEEFMQSLSVEVTYNAQYVPVSQAGAHTNAKFNDKNEENPRIKLNADSSTRERAEIQLVFKNPMTGSSIVLSYLNDPLQYAFLDKSGNYVPNFNEGLATDSELFFGAEKEIVDRYKRHLSLVNYLVAEAQKGNTTFSLDSLEGYGFRLGNFSYNFATKLNEPKAAWEEVASKLGYSPTDKVVILDRKFISGTAITEENFTVVNGEFEKGEAKQYREALKSNPYVLNGLGRYVAIKLVPGAKPVVIELSPKNLTEERLDTLVNQLGTKIEDIRAKLAEGKDVTKEVIEFNDSFNNQFYVGYTISAGSRAQNFNVALEVRMNGTLRVNISPNNIGRTQIAGFDFNLNAAPKSFAELLSAVNTAIEANNNQIRKPQRAALLKPFDASMFFENINKDLDASDLSNFKTNVTASPLKAPSVIITQASLENLGGIEGVSLEEVPGSKVESEPVNDQLEALGSASSQASIEAEAEGEVEAEVEVSGIDQQINEVKKKIKERRKGLKPSQVAKDEQLKKLHQQLKDLRDKKNTANKVGNDFTFENEQQLEDFLGWVRAVLPDFITVESVDIIRDRMVKEGMTVGRFFTQIRPGAKGISELEGVIEITKDSPFKYHEAFHAVFRMLLSDQEIQKVLKLGEKELRADLRKKGMTMDQAIAKMVKTSSLYDGMSRQELKERLIEEFLADKFEEFKKDPKNTKINTEVKSLFRKILDFFIELFNDYPVDRITSVDQLFRTIDSGELKGRGVSSNQFTRDAAFSDNMAYAVLEYTEDTGGTDVARYLNAEDSQYILSSITALVDRARRETEEGSIEDLTYEALDTVSNLFDSDIKTYENPALQKRADQIYDVLGNPEAIASIVEYVEDQIAQFDAADQFMKDSLDALEDEFGGSARSSWSEEAESIGGLTSLPTLVRAVIGTTPVAEIDAFGNEFYIDAEGNLLTERIIVAADAPTVYNGLVRILADSSSDVDMFERLQAQRVMQSKSTSKSQTVTFIDKLFDTLGVSVLPDGSLDLNNIKRPQLFQAFVRAFDVSKRTYNFMAIDIKSGRVVTFESNRSNEAVTQLQTWQSAHDANVGSITSDSAARASTILNEVKDVFNESEYSANEVAELLQEFADITGIEISPAFVEYSYYKSRWMEGKLDLGSLEDQDLAFVITNTKVPAMTKEDLSNIANSFTVSKGRQLFLKNFEDVERTEENQASFTVGGRFKVLAEGNVFFNENIDTTTFNNANNKKIQTYQARNVITKVIQSLKDPAVRERIMNDPYLAEKQYLLSNEDFMAIIDELTTENIDGIGERKLSSQDKEAFGSTDRGRVYKGMTPREFMTQQLFSYTSKMKSVNGVITVPTLIRIMEASSQGMTVGLPITDAVEYNFKSENGYEFTDSYLDAIITEVERDLARITRVAAEIDDPRVPQLMNYHNGALRGLKLGETGDLISEELKQKLEEKAQKGEDISVADAKKLRKEIAEGLNAQFNLYKDKLANEGILAESVTLRQMLPGYAPTQGSSAVVSVKKGASLELVAHSKDEGKAVRDKKLSHNIAQYFFNDYLNTLAINQLVTGDPAESFKGPIDIVKRAKGYNVSGIKAAHSIVPADPNLGITSTFDQLGDLEHITFEDDAYTDGQFADKQDRDDGQLYMSVKGLRHVLFGMGRLTQFQAKVLNKLENGQKLTDAEVFGAFGKKGSVQFNAQTNSLKLVYFDGKNYLKMSAFLLTPEFVDRMSGNGLEGGNNFLANLLNKIQLREAQQGNVVFASPVSASKGRKANVIPRTGITSGNELLDSKYFNPLDPNYLYLSTETPSNKLKINNPTQMRHIILSELDGGKKVYVNGQETTVDALRKEYLQNDKSILTSRYLDKRKQLFDLEDFQNEIRKSRNLKQVTPKLEEFREYVVETLKGLGASPQEIAVFKDNTIDLNNPITLERFEQFVLSMFNKTVIQDKLPGYKLTLVSDSGVKVIRKRGTAKENGTSVDSVVSYEFFNKLSKEEQDSGDYYMDDLRYGVEEYGKDGKTVIGTYSEMMMPPHKKDAMGLNGEVTESGMFGVRIPSQDKHSAINLRVVDYLPAHYGSVGIFPKELVELSGADFDIDSLFVHRKEFYRDSAGDVKFHGEGSEQDRFEAYLRFLAKTNSDVKQGLQDGKLNAFVADVLDEVVEEVEYTLTDIKTAAREAGLPSTLKEYNKAVKENNNVDINLFAVQNRQLDIKMSLLGNSIMEPASLKAFEKFADYLKENAPEYYNKLQEQRRFINNALGKAESFFDIHEGAENIGPAVNTAIAYAFLNTMGVSATDAAFEIDGVEYKSFNNTEATDGSRIMDNLSTLITAMTDNAKEQLASKYGLNIEAVGQFAYMLSLGVPFNKALLLFQQPVVKEFFRRTANASSILNFNSDGSQKQMANLTATTFKELEMTLGEASEVTEEMMVKDLSLTETFADLVKDEDAINSQASVLALFKKIYTQSQTMRELASVVKVGAGVGQTMDQFDYKNDSYNKFVTEDTLEEIKKSGFPVEGLKEAIENHSIIQTEAEIRRELDVLFKSLFVSKAPLVKATMESIESSLSTSRTGYGKAKKQALNDFLGALLVKAYKTANSSNSRVLKNLSNGLIYEDLKASQPNVESVTEIVGSLRRHLKAAGKTNKFIQQYVFSIPAINPDGTASKSKGVNQLKSNSFTKLSPELVQRLEAEMAELLSDDTVLDNGSTVRDNTLDLIHYLLVKDGLQFKSGSFLRSVPAEALSQIFSVNTRVIEAVKSAESFEEIGLNVFGENNSVRAIMAEFLLNWGEHAASTQHLRSIFDPAKQKVSKNLIEKKKEVGSRVFEFVESDGDAKGVLNISLFNDYAKDKDFAFRMDLIRNANFEVQTTVTEKGTRHNVVFPMYIKIGRDVYKLRTWQRSESGTEPLYNEETGEVLGTTQVEKGVTRTVTAEGISDFLVSEKRANGDFKIKGNQAQYVKVTKKGEASQNFGGAYALGAIPDYKAPEVPTETKGKPAKPEETGKGVKSTAPSQGNAWTLTQDETGATVDTTEKSTVIEGLSEESPAAEIVTEKKVPIDKALEMSLRQYGYIYQEIKDGKYYLNDVVGGPTVIEESKFNSWFSSLEANRPQQLEKALGDMFEQMNQAAQKNAASQGLTPAEMKQNLENATGSEISTRSGFISTMKTLLSIPGVEINLEDIFDRIQSCYL